MTVEHGYVLQDEDYPDFPETTDYVCFWETYTDPITEDITILGGYRSAYHTVTFIANTSISSDISMIAAQPSKTTTITVADGYVLRESDYPEMPEVLGCSFAWGRYRAPITEDITITGKYEKSITIDPPTPPVETVSLPGGDTQGTVQPISTGTLESTVVETHSYVYNGSQLTQETITTKTTTGTSTTTTTEVLYYAYDASGTPMSVEYTNASGTKTTYYYAVNIQGDVTAILNTSGSAVVTYTYDAWGNPLSTSGSLASTLGERNSLRYRGYVYDSETGYYYLQSRYYNPELGRFINADAFVSTGQGLLGYNMFAYCGNNSVMYCDYDGCKYVALIECGGGSGGAKRKTVRETMQELNDSLGLPSNGTVTVGMNLSGAFGIGGSLALGFTVDNVGNIGIIVSGNVGGGFPSAACTGFVTVTSADNIFNQNGMATQVGGSIDAGLSLGGEMVIFQDPETQKTYYGGTAMAGIGVAVPAEFHGEVGYSKVLGFNVYDTIDAIIDFFCDLF